MKRIIIGGLHLVYFSLLFYIFFLARRRRGPALPWHQRPVNLVPLKAKFEYFSLPRWSLTGADRWNFYSDFLGNVVLFIPFAFFLVYTFRVRTYRKVVLVTLLTSIGIELIQFIFSIGVADIDDIILNVSGAIIGMFLIKVTQHFAPFP